MILYIHSMTRISHPREQLYRADYNDCDKTALHRMAAHTVAGSQQAAL